MNGKYVVGFVNLYDNVLIMREVKAYTAVHACLMVLHENQWFEDRQAANFQSLEDLKRLCLNGEILISAIEVS